MHPALDRELGGDVASDDAFRAMVARLSKLSVARHFDAYADVAWDDPDMRVDPADARWTALAVDPVAGTDWYRGLGPEERARYGLYRIAAAMKVGWHFENLLQRGLLVWAFRLPNGAPEFRYVHHEIVEESQHTLMFQELVDRSGLPVRGMPLWARAAAALAVVPAARWDAPLFFFLVLGGEDPVDHVQRVELQRGSPHPLVERIMRIHVTEEARHISFARNYLRHTVPRLGRARRQALAVVVPVVMGVMTRLMLEPPSDLRRHCGLPDRVARRAMRSPEGRRLLVDSARKVRRLCEELGLMTRAGRATWRAVGLAGGDA
ncbi:MAG TPA: diiron oxygenase [Acidimicrobiales bacterium]